MRPKRSFTVSYSVCASEKIKWVTVINLYEQWMGTIMISCSLMMGFAEPKCLRKNELNRNKHQLIATLYCQQETSRFVPSQQ